MTATTLQSQPGLYPSSFALLCLVMTILTLYLARNRTLGLRVGLWLVTTSILAVTPLLTHFQWFPPPAPMLFFWGFLFTWKLGKSDLVQRLVSQPLPILVGIQSFRILAEILIHQAVQLGLAPPQLTWTGLNWDIATGISALLLAGWAHKAPRQLLVVWNYFGMALLGWVVVVAAMSFPTRVQLIRPDNTWVAHWPYVWLPTILVNAAFLWHLCLWRRLRLDKSVDTSGTLC